jgi:hypothetical protein
MTLRFTSRAAAFLAALVAFTCQSNAEPSFNSPGAQASKPYYIEFRVARIGTYGHSYVAYGRLNAQGQPAEARYADHHPRGNYALMALGHLLPVPANTKWDPEVLTLPIDSSYRRKLTPTQYKKLVAAIQRFKADKQPYWNAVTNNCNHYVGELARAVGLRTPTNFQVSYAFVPALRDLNEPAGPGNSTQDRRTGAQSALPQD